MEAEFRERGYDVRPMHRVVVCSLLALAACAPSPRPCMGVGTCPEGSECLANRCTLLGADPVAADTRRLVVVPSTIRVLGAADREASGELGPAVTFGSASGGAALFLKFPPSWRRAKRIDSAFLVLDPMPGTRRGPQDVSVEAWRVGKAWEADSIRWLEKPDLLPPRAAGVARAAPPMPLRVDVTAIVLHLWEHPENDHGIALTAGGGSDVGVSFATGASGGSAPRLELYVH